MRAQLIGLLDAAREHRKRAFHRLYEYGVVEVPGSGRVFTRIQASEAKVGIGRNLRQHAPRVQLVLRGEDAFRRRARQPEPLGHQRRGQGAELLVMRKDSLPAAPPPARRLPRREAFEVERRQLELAREREQVEAGMIAAHRATGRAEPPHRLSIPVVSEEPADAGRGTHPSCPPACRPGQWRHVLSQPEWRRDGIRWRAVMAS